MSYPAFKDEMPVVDPSRTATERTSSGYRLPDGVGSEADQRRATCMDLIGLDDRGLVEERSRLISFIDSDSPDLHRRLFIPRLGLPVALDWAINRGLLIEGLLRSGGFEWNPLFVAVHAPSARMANDPLLQGGEPRPRGCDDGKRGDSPSSNDIWLPLNDPYEPVRPRV